MMREAEKDRTSKHKLTGQGSLAESLTGSWGTVWSQFCWAGSELGTRGEREEILVRSDL